jgi:hypothetical protein
MGQVLHDCATTTEAIRRAIQHSQESLGGLSRRYGINPKTVAKWKKRGLEYRRSSSTPNLITKKIQLIQMVSNYDLRFSTQSSATERPNSDGVLRHVR